MQSGPEVTAAEGLEASGSTVGVTGVTDVIIGDGGSGATGDKTAMLIAVRETDVPSVGEGASMRSAGKQKNTTSKRFSHHFPDWKHLAKECLQVP